MDDALLEDLLHQDESETLDFKRDQYPFAGANDHQKSELLKDILAFANAWRRTDAYILVGVEEVKGGRSNVTGISDHLAESNIQQFVNGKTNNPISFSYQAYSYEGKQLGIIKIPVQERPFFITNDFGPLKKYIVYIRRGSSTDIADPDEVAKMGMAKVDVAPTPTFELQFADPTERLMLGDHVTVTCHILELPSRDEIPSAPLGGRNPFGIPIEVGVNSNYYREFADHLLDLSRLSPIGFSVQNTGESLLTNAQIHTSVPLQDEVIFRDHLPSPPTYNYIAASVRADLRGAFSDPSIVVDTTSRDWRIWMRIGDVQPKQTSWSDVLYVGSVEPQVIDLEMVVSADNLPNPVSVPLKISVETEEISWTVRELIDAVDDYRNQR